MLTPGSEAESSAHLAEIQANTPSANPVRSPAGTDVYFAYSFSVHIMMRTPSGEKE